MTGVEVTYTFGQLEIENISLKIKYQMNKHLKRSIGFIVTLVFFISCRGQATDSIFIKGKIWEYNCVIYSTEKEVINSFPITMEVESNLTAFLSQQTPIVYTYPYNEETIKETTGIIEDETGISIHQPRLGDLYFTAILPMPSINYPLQNESESQSETKIVKSSFNEINGKTIKQAKRTVGTDTISYKKEMITCYMYEAENLNLLGEVGKYSLKYWFNEKYGFVKYLYTKPDGSIVEINLENIIKK